MIENASRRIGITGSIGSGKTTVCKAFASLGIPIFYADREAKKLYYESDIMDQVVAIAGPNARTQKGEPNYAFIASVFFNDDHIYNEISALLHPLLSKRYLQWIESNKHVPYTIIEAAVLFESGLDRHVDYSVVVTCPEHIRISRVMARDHHTMAEIEQRIQRQYSQDILISRSDFVLVNDGETPLLPQIIHLDQQFRSSNQ